MKILSISLPFTISSCYLLLEVVPDMDNVFKLLVGAGASGVVAWYLYHTQLVMIPAMRKESADALKSHLTVVEKQRTDFTDALKLMMESHKHQLDRSWHEYREDRQKDRDAMHALKDSINAMFLKVKDLPDKQSPSHS